MTEDKRMTSISEEDLEKVSGGSEIMIQESIPEPSTSGLSVSANAAPKGTLPTETMANSGNGQTREHKGFLNNIMGMFS